MQDHRFEEPDEERARETVDALAEHETFAHARGDDRACEQLRQHLDLFARGAATPSLRLKGRGTQTPVDSGTATGHMPLLSQPAASPSGVAGAGGHVTEEAA